MRFDDPRWDGLAGGYGDLYDPRPALRRLAEQPADQSAWDELWEQLHHQGDLGLASYCAVPALADLSRRWGSAGWQPFALAATIEVERHLERNPDVPQWLVDEYQSAWATLVASGLDCLLASQDPLTLKSALAVVALGRGLTQLGALLHWHDESTLSEAADEAFAWTEEYVERTLRLPAS